MSAANASPFAAARRGPANAALRSVRIGSTTFAAATCLACALAQAQSCIAPVEVPGPPSGWEFAGNTLDGDTSFAGLCGGAVGATGPVWVYHLRPWTTSTEIRIIDYAGPWNPVLLLVDASEPCGAESECLASGTTGSPLQLPSAPFGDYWLYVTSSAFDTPGSGGYFQLTMNGFPDDPDDPDFIFADGFD